MGHVILHVANVVVVENVRVDTLTTIFISTHHMSECKTSHSQYDTPTINRLIGAIVARKSVREAGCMFGITKSSLDRIWNHYKLSRNTQNLPCSGRPKEVSDRTKRLVVRTTITNRRKPFYEIANEMHPKISESTV